MRLKVALSVWVHRICFVAVLFLLLTHPTQTANAQGVEPWRQSLEQQLEMWEAAYPGESLDFVVVRLGVGSSPEDALRVSAEYSSKWQRPVLALPLYSDPNTRFDDGLQAYSQYVNPGSVNDNGVEVLRTIMSHNDNHHAVSHLVLYSGSVVALNAEKDEYGQFIQDHGSQLGLKSVDTLGAFAGQGTNATLQSSGVATGNWGDDFVIDATKPVWEYQPERSYLGSPLPLPIVGDYIDSAIAKFSAVTASAISEPESHRLEPLLDTWGRERNVAPFGGDTAPPPLSPPPSMLNEVGAMLESEPDTGGIDFSSLEIRYMSESFVDTYTFGAAFRGMPTSPELSIDQEQAIELAWSSMYVWLAMPPESFWVNLNPSERDRIIDPELGKTDTGRILLEADFEMKKTVAVLIHPDTALGQAYWDALYGFPDVEGPLCFYYRQWIVPGEVTAWTSDDSIYVVDATLDVKLESEYREPVDAVDSPETDCPPDADPAMQEHAESVFRSMILPELIEAVNEVPEYQDLRNVYYSRIIAEWYKTQHATGQESAFSHLIGSGSVADWYSTEPWDPMKVFEEYVRSAMYGEFNEMREFRRGNYEITETYFYGGVDFRALPITEISYSELLVEEPVAEQQIFDALFKPTGYRDQDEVWVGGLYAAELSAAASSGVSPQSSVESGAGRSDGKAGGEAAGDDAGDSGESATPASKSFAWWWIIVLAMILVVAGVRLGRRQRRTRSIRWSHPNQS